MAKWNIWKKITETISKSKTWLDGQSNAVKVLCAGAMSVIIFVLAYLAAIKNSDSNSVGYWNFIILIVSAPVAFVIWHFRDENNRQQIENPRKDINLKEFQKLSEWVSGAHLPEIKTVSKTTQKSSLKDGVEVVEKTTERSEEYSKKPDTADFDTFSKREGAVALQISAIYNLLPFFRGDYGESFRLPAFNLLKSAWQAMQQDSLKKLDEEKLSDEALNKIFNELEQKANSPMGVALTQVLLSLNRENTELNLRDFSEMLPNICLAGMNFHLSGVSEIARDLSRLNLQGANFQKSNLQDANFQGTDLKGADFSAANLNQADIHMKKLMLSFDSQNINFQRASLSGSDLKNRNLTGSNFKNAHLANAILQRTGLAKANFLNAHLYQVDLQEAYFFKTNLDKANLYSVDLRGSNLVWSQLRKSGWKDSAKITVNDFIKNIYPDWKKENDSEWEALTEGEQTKAMQQFCNETGMLIVDESGIQEIMLSL